MASYRYRHGFRRFYSGNYAGRIAAMDPSCSRTWVSTVCLWSRNLCLWLLDPPANADGYRRLHGRRSCSFDVRNRVAASSDELKGSASDAIKAFSAGQADLAVVRADIGDLSSAATVVVVARSVVLIVAPAGSSITEMDDLKGKTVGVIDGEENRKIVEALTREYSLDTVKTRFKNLALGEIPQALKSKQADALLVVMPLSEKHLTMLRNFIPKAGKLNPTVVPIESAGAIAAVTGYYQAYELPKGTIRGSPSIPDERNQKVRQRDR